MKERGRVPKGAPRNEESQSDLALTIFSNKLGGITS